MTMKAMATRVMATPTGAKSNMVNFSPRRRSARSDISRLGGVPIKVVMPPSKVEKDSGINSSDTE